MINIGDGLSRNFPFRRLDLIINILAQPDEIKNASEYIVELLNTREVHREARGVQPSAFRTCRLFLKTPKCLYNSTMHEDFFYKMLRKSRALKLVT